MAMQLFTVLVDASVQNSNMSTNEDPTPDNSSTSVP